MISDTLFDAIAEIDRYLADPATAAAYSEPDVHAEVMRVRGEMDKLREMLDGVDDEYADPSPPPRTPMYRLAFRHIATGHEYHNGVARYTEDAAVRLCAAMNEKWKGRTEYWPEAVYDALAEPAPASHAP